MQGRPHSGIATILVLALVSACAPRPALTPPTPAGSELGTVQLRLEGFGAAPRSTQVAPSFARAILRLNGASMAAEKSVERSLSLGASEFTIGNVPPGGNLVFTVEGLDAQGRPLPGARYATVVDVAPGATVSARVGALTTPRADVVLALLAEDRAAGRSVEQALAARLDDAALQSRLESERARLGVVHPALFDAAAIARAIAGQADPAATASVSPPSDLSAFVRAPGRVRIRLKGLPSGSPATVWLDDPVSPKQQNLAVGSYDLMPVAPGRWTLSAEAPGGFRASVPVTVASGLAEPPAEVLLDLGRWEVLQALAKPLAASLCVPLTLEGVPSLVLAGGLDANLSSGYATDSCYAFDGTRLTVLPRLPEPRSFAGGAVAGDRLYLLGGRTETGELSGDVFRFEGNRWAPFATASTGFAGAVSVAYGSSIYLFGGTLGDGGLIFDTETQQYRNAPKMDLSRLAPASAVYQDRLYVFGAGTQGAPLKGCHVFDPASGLWSNLESLPIGRFGARAVALGDKIYVVGGVDATGRPSGRVDVYDPAANSWAPFSALQTPRAASAVEALGGRIYVLGGSDGFIGSLIQVGVGIDKPVPTGAVEALRP